MKCPQMIFSKNLCVHVCWTSKERVSVSEISSFDRARLQWWPPVWPLSVCACRRTKQVHAEQILHCVCADLVVLTQKIFAGLHCCRSYADRLLITRLEYANVSKAKQSIGTERTSPNTTTITTGHNFGLIPCNWNASSFRRPWQTTIRMSRTLVPFECISNTTYHILLGLSRTYVLRRICLHGKPRAKPYGQAIDESLWSQSGKPISIECLKSNFGFDCIVQNI